MSKRLKTFTVSAKLDAEVSIEISARDYTDAVDRATELDIHDFVKILGDYVDGGIAGITYIGSFNDKDPAKLLEAK